jgi:hypothetical protein
VTNSNSALCTDLAMIQAEQLLLYPAASLHSYKLDRHLSSLTKKKIGVIMRVFARAYSLEAGVIQAGLISLSSIIMCISVFLPHYLQDLFLVSH